MKVKNKDGTYNDGIRPTDKEWIASYFYRDNKGAVHLKREYAESGQILFHPPEPKIHTPGICSLQQLIQYPDVNTYFRRPIMMLRPSKFWSFKCPSCSGPLANSGFYSVVKEVYSLSWPYYVAQEHFSCNNKKCTKSRFLSQDLIQYMPIEHREKFKVHISKFYVLDNQIMDLMRGCLSISDLRDRVLVANSEEYSRRLLDYLKACEITDQARANPFAKNVPQDKAAMAPPMHRIPSQQYFSQMYVLNVESRMKTELLPALTSTKCDKILKIDSTVHILSHLAPNVRQSVQWMTNVMNESGQFVQSVLTQGEGIDQLRAMCVGVIKRFHRNKWKPPKVIYIDRDCCGDMTTYHKLFDPEGIEGVDLSEEEIEAWKYVQIRLDIYHLMTRHDVGLTTTHHIKYNLFEAGMANCFFRFDPVDLENLQKAKIKVMNLELGLEEEDHQVGRKLFMGFGILEK